MQYEKCIKCEKLGVSCGGPNFLLMTSQEVVEWCKERKKHLKITRDKLKDLTGVPLGTLNRFFSEHNNSYFYFDTACKIITVLISGGQALDNCLIVQGQQQAERLESEITFLKRENEDLKCIILEALTGNIKKLGEV